MRASELTYMIIDDMQATDNARSMSSACSLLGISRSGYIQWVRRKQTCISDPYMMKIKNEMHLIAVAFPRYGYRRMTIELRRRGYRMNKKRVLNLMTVDNLLCVKQRYVPRTTDSDHNFPRYPNLAKDIVVTGLNQLWVADITYIRLVREFVYLAVIIDVFSRKCIGWALSRDIDTNLTMSALDAALKSRTCLGISGLIHHSDQGVQYASHEYVNLLKEHGISISMSRRGNPYDNAFAESFMKTLKYEEVYLCEYESYDEAFKHIQEFIEVVYNKKRIHSGIGYATPVEFEMAVINGG